jgi:hypothetical protein
VGTSSPSAPLTVVASSNNTDVAIFNGSTGTSRGLKLSTGTNFNSDALVIYDAQEATYGAHLFRTRGTNALFIDQSQRVGIGTTSPSYLLDCAGDTRISGTNGLRIEGGGTGTQFYNNAGGTILDSFTASTSLRLLTQSTERARIDSSGRVGIGTTSPGAVFHVTSADDAKTSIIAGASGRIRSLGYLTSFNASVIEAVNNAETLFAPFLVNGSQLLFGIERTERARIDSSGRLLVGTSTSTNNIRLQESFAVVNKGQGTLGGASLTSYSGTDSSARALIDFQRSRGITDGSMTVVASGDDLGSVVWRGADGTNFIDSAVINAQVDGTPGANDMPGRLVFSTTADGASSPTPRMTIKSSGIVNITNTPTYADNTAALAGGLVAGDIYRKSDGTLMITY